MSQTHIYFTIPFEMVPEHPGYQAWFAAWAAVKPRLNSEREPRPFVIGVTTASVPAEAALLGTGPRSPSSHPPPPPPPESVSLLQYQQAFRDWLKNGTDGDSFTYFTIPFDQIHTDLACKRLWFATWSPVRPALVSGQHPPLVVGVISTPSLPRAGASASEAISKPPLPEGATLLTAVAKDPQIPPPAAPPPGTSLVEHRRWMNDRAAD